MTRTLLLALLFACGPALAQGTGWYIGGGLGSTKADFVSGDFDGTIATGTRTSDDDDVGSRFFGGYRLSPNLAVEGGLAFLGSYKHRYNDGGQIAVYDYNASALTIALAGNLPVAGGFSLNGRVGVAFTAAELRLRRDDGNAITLFCPDSWWYSDCASQSTNLYWGLGAQFDVGPRWSVRLDYDNYGEVGEEFETGRADIETVSVNFVWRF
jgi:opacity protein-like surface antigen